MIIIFYELHDYVTMYVMCVNSCFVWVPLNYNFIFTHVDTCGNTIKLYPLRVCVDHVFLWRGTYKSHVIYHMARVVVTHGIATRGTHI